MEASLRSMPGPIINHVMTSHYNNNVFNKRKTFKASPILINHCFRYFEAQRPPHVHLLASVSCTLFARHDPAIGSISSVRGRDLNNCARLPPGQGADPNERMTPRINISVRSTHHGVNAAHCSCSSIYHNGRHQPCKVCYAQPIFIKPDHLVIPA